MGRGIEAAAHAENQGEALRRHGLPGLAGYDQFTGGIRQHAQRRGDTRERFHQQLPAAVSVIADCRAALFAVLLAIAPATTARAQDYPSRHISVIIPAGPGAPPDTILRIVADPMSRALGQQIVLENVPGSGGITADRRAAGAAADGYTLLMASFRYPCRRPRALFESRLRSGRELRAGRSHRLHLCPAGRAQTFARERSARPDWLPKDK